MDDPTGLIILSLYFLLPIGGIGTVFFASCILNLKRRRNWQRFALKPITYYGCRNCRQSVAYLEGQVAATLDSRLEAKYIQKNGVIRMNWLALRHLFDFECVEIVRATDEDVERFAVQVGNDTNPSRKARYKKMVCILSSECQLTENTQKILRRMFGQLEMKKQGSGRF